MHRQEGPLSSPGAEHRGPGHSDSGVQPVPVAASQHACVRACIKLQLSRSVKAIWCLSLAQSSLRPMRSPVAAPLVPLEGTWLVDHWWLHSPDRCRGQ